MAQLTNFSYRAGVSPLYQLDPRVKLVSLLMLNVTSICASVCGLAVLSVLLISILVSSLRPLMPVLSEIRFVIIFLLALVVFRALTNHEQIIWQVQAISISKDGLSHGGIFSWRLLLVIFWGLTLIRTTKNTEIRAAIQWFLKPIPFIPEKRAALMISLMTRFLPVMLEIFAEIANAQRSRCVGNRRNPVYRLKALMFPFLRRVFNSADQLAEAMTSRCYSENRTDPIFRANKWDGAVLLFVSVILLSLIFIPNI